MDRWQDMVLPEDGTLGDLALTRGCHAKREDGVCVMEAVAWLAGEPHNDSPKCACQVVATFARRMNDRLDDANRQRLREFIPQIAGSKASRDVERRRGFLAADYAVRVFAPIALDAAGKPDLAKRLRECAPVVDKETASRARDLACEVRKAAYAAAAAADANASTAYAAANAAAYATDAAAAANAAAYATAYAAAVAAATAYADDAADAAAYAADAADAVKARIVEARFDLLRLMLNIKEAQ